MRRTVAVSLCLFLASVAAAQGDPMLGVRVPGDSTVMRMLSVPVLVTSRDSAPTVSATTPQWCRNGGKGKRLAQTAVAGTFIGGNLALYEYFRRAWWSGPRAKFRLNYDWDGNFRDQDKLGHMLGGYLLAEGGRELLQAACVSEKKAALWGVAYAAAFQLQIELWDGTQARYGFSPPDMLYNTIGQGISLSHAFVKPMRAVMPTISYARTQALKNTQAGLIPGDLRTTVDYSGQTYWLSVDVDTLLPKGAKRYWPDLLRFSIGHTITDFIDPTSGADIRAQRRIMLTLDIDPLKLPGNAPWWVAVKKGLRHYHFPSPALEFRSGGVKAVPWHR